MADPVSEGVGLIETVLVVGAIWIAYDIVKNLGSSVSNAVSTAADNVSQGYSEAAVNVPNHIANPVQEAVDTVTGALGLNSTLPASNMGDSMAAWTNAAAAGQVNALASPTTDPADPSNQ